MSAQQGKNSADEHGRSGDIQARQTDDGSFELVVDSASPTPAPSAAEVDQEAQAGPARARRGARKGRLALFIGGALVAVGVVAYAVSGDKPTAKQTDAPTARSDGFRPYQEGPGQAAAAAIKAHHEDSQPQVADDQTPPEENEPDQADAKDDWDPAKDSEVIVIDDGTAAPDEAQAQDDQDHPDDQNQPDNQAPRDEPADKAKVHTIDPAELHGLQPQVKLPHPPPALKRLPIKQLQQVRQGQPVDDLPPEGADRNDGQPPADDDLPPAQDGVQDDRAPAPDNADNPDGEYDNSNAGSNGYDQGH